MKIIYGQYGNEKFYARAEGEKVYPVKGLPYDGICEDGRVLNAKDVTLLAPCRPGKIVAVGLNYLDHIKEMNDPMPDEPVIFLKPPSAVIGPNDAIVLPKRAERVDFEAELAAVIGKKCRNVSIEDADSVIFGYTCLNDVSARDLQKVDGQWARAKGYDTFSPIGPCIVTDFDPSDAPISSVLNGKVQQDATTALMMRSAQYLVSFISSVMTLEPGDVISMGTPQGVNQIKDGDTIEIRIGGIGSLVNTVCAE